MLLWQALLLASVSSAEPAAATFVTPLDYFDSGRQHVENYLEQSDLLRETANALTQRCARVEVRSTRGEGIYHSILGSGVLLGDGRHLLTAGHVVEGFDHGEILVHFPSGESLVATLDDSRYEAFGPDWAILTLHGTAPLADGLEIATLPVGSLAFVLGYPDHIGIDPRGDLVFGESSTRFLQPIVTLGTVSGTDPLTLEPHVGAVPTEGMSGGPVFDLQGRLAGILVSVAREPGAESLYHYRIVPVGGVPEATEMTPPLDTATSSHPNTD